jgi:hypothetical protein
MRLAITMCLMTISLMGFSQMTGGGSGASAPKAKQEGGDPNKWTALHFGLSQPMGKFKQNSLNSPFNEAVGAKPGMYIAWDANKYFNTANPMKLGISYTLGVNWNGVNWETWVPGTTEFTGSPFINSHFKVGPVATYELGNDMAVDAFFRLGLGLGVSGSGYWSTNGSYQEFYTETPGVAFVTGLGANFRWQNLMATMQINPAKYTFSYLTYGMSSTPSLDYKVPMSTFWLGVGFVFNKSKSVLGAG